MFFAEFITNFPFDDDEENNVTLLYSITIVVEIGVPLSLLVTFPLTVNFRFLSLLFLLLNVL